MNKKKSYDAFGVDLPWDIRSTESYSEHDKALYVDTCCTCRKQGNLWERWQVYVWGRFVILLSTWFIVNLHYM